MATQANLVQQAVLEFLRRYPPFNAMSGEALTFMVDRLRLNYFAKEALIQSTEQPATTLFILHRGRVKSQSSIDAAGKILNPGECFPIGALLAQRPPNNRYTALEDCFCLQLAANDFQQLLNRSAQFQAFCTRYVASLLQQTYQVLQTEFSQRTAEEHAMSKPIASLLKRTAVTCSPETPVYHALKTMREKRIGSIAIVDGEHKPLGIFSVHDLLDLTQVPNPDLHRPIGEVMRTAQCVLPDSASAHEAALAMTAQGVRHVLVVREGKLLGVISEHDLFAMQRVSMRQITESIAMANDLTDLQQAAQDIRKLAVNLIAQGIAAESLTQFISALNDQLTKRIIALHLIKHELSDVRFCWLALGSEGRHEQTFATDQDNGLLFVAEKDFALVRERLLAFAAEVNQTLDRCGFPLCKGNIMASNPQWCLSETEWQEAFRHWIHTPLPSALLNANIFFDFRSLYGEHLLAERLQTWLYREASGNPLFLRAMASNALENDPPLGQLRDFVTDDDHEQAPHTIDLKARGARLFVDAARIYALATDSLAGNTAVRLRLSGKKLRISEEEISSVVDAFHFVQLLRLKQQVVSADSFPNRINPDQLNELDRRILKESLRQARKLQRRLRLDYQL